MPLGRYNVGPCCGCGGDGPATICDCLPASNLTVTVVGIFGPRSYPLIYDPVLGTWASACHSQVLYRLSCVAGVIFFSASSYSGAPCPVGSPVICTSTGASPRWLPPLSQSCEPLLLEFSASQCPAMSAQGYTKFTVTL